MADDGKVTFLVMATFPPSNYTRPFFVRAATIPDAYVDVITSNREAFQTPAFKFDISVIGLDQIPDVKEVARKYWEAGRTLEPSSEFGTFEEFWEEHGASPEEREH